MCEAHLSPSYSGSVVVDIGGAVGALIVSTPSELDGREIEVSSAGRPGRIHTDVRERQLPDGRMWAAVFAALSAGEYTLHGQGAVADRRVVVEGGMVTQLSWVEVPTGSDRLLVG